MTVLNPNSEEIGVLDKKMATVLRLLKTVSGSIRYSVFPSSEVDVDQKERRSGDTIPLEININGPVQSLKRIGEVLSDAGMFLQEPTSLEHGVLYQNPHFLSWGDETTTPLFARPGELPPNDFADSIEEVMGCSEATFRPRIFFQDRRIMTPLKRSSLNRGTTTIADASVLFLGTK